MGEVDYVCFAGACLVACNNSHPKISNGAFLDVVELTDGGVLLRDLDTDEQLTVTNKALAAHTRLRHALTLCSVQGRSLSGTVAIHDVHSRHFSVTHLYVALSKARHGDDVWIVNR